MIFQFEIVNMDIGDQGKFSPRAWELSTLKSIVDKWQRFMIDNEGWNALYLENHDQGRSVSRFGSDLPEFRIVSAKMLATFLALQSGTLFIYQGQELGMINVEKSRPISDYRDLETLNAWKEIIEKYPDDKELQRTTMHEIWLKSRDNSRTPMQWSNSKYAGFSSSEPWQKENESYVSINAESQVGIAGSCFEFWASLLRLRKSHKDIFIYGDFELVDVQHADVFAYIRSFEGQKAIVVSNFKKVAVK